MYHVSFDLDFRRNDNLGKFIAIEGIDGSGKSTQRQILTQLLTQQGKNVINTHEPTRQGPIGKLIHDVLQADVKIPLVGLQYLFSADRAVHQESVTIPALRKGDTVVSERCFWSAVPYGLTDRENINYENEGEPLLTAYSILSLYHQFLLPNVTFYLDIPVEVAVERLAEMSKQKEIYEKKEKLEKIKKGYDLLLKKFPDEFVVIDGQQPVEKITAEILSRIMK